MGSPTSYGSNTSNRRKVQTGTKRGKGATDRAAGGAKKVEKAKK